MKLLRRNCTEFKYYAYTGLDSDVNDDGLHTGIWKPVYEKPVVYKGNISAPSGAAVQAFDGIEIRYTHILLMNDIRADIRETGYIEWRGKQYDITAVRHSINTLSVALEQRIEDNGDQYNEPEGDS